MIHALGCAVAIYLALGGVAMMSMPSTLYVDDGPIKLVLLWPLYAPWKLLAILGVIAFVALLHVN